MNETKKIWQSKTIIASVITLIAIVLGLFGYNFSDVDQASLGEIITSTIGAFATIVAMYGRIKASHKLEK